MIGPRHHDLPGLQRLSQRIEGRFGEFGKLIKEQYPTMRQRNFAWPRPRAATDKRRHRSRMMWVTERTALHKPTGGKLASDRVQHRHIQRLTR